MEKQTWKVSDIAGSSIIDEKGDCVGILTDVLPTGANDVWVIRTNLNSSGEMLLPALRSVVQNVDVEAKIIRVVMPAGLREVYEEHAEQKEDEE